MKKVNKNYLDNKKYVPASPCMKNKKYIDNWVSENYEKLFKFFSNKKSHINSRAYSQVDIFHDSIFRIYTNKTRMFISQEDANNYLNLFFNLV